MDYQQTIDYLFENLPMFHRVGPAALKNNLDNTLALDKAYENPHRQYKTIHIAGTNGKGSVSHTLASVLQCSGYKTGLFTSPHLKDFRERIRVNGEMIPEEAVINFIQRYIEKNRTMKLQTSFFELTACMAFNYFSEMDVDVAVIEVGLGGRLDSTNIISPVLSIITNISYDHVSILGNTLEKIAIEKAGIIKVNTPVVIGETQPETELIFRNFASKKNAPIFFADQELHINKQYNGLYSASSNRNSELIDIELELKGNYQQKNLATVLTASQKLKEIGFNIEEKNIREGLKNVVAQTGLLGRWQEIGKNPRIICDTGHNEAGIRFVMEQLENEHHNQLHIVFGMVNDKDIESILPLLPLKAVYYFTKAKVERALNEKILQEKAALFRLTGKSYPTVNEALDAAISNANANDLIFVGGSTFVVAEVV
jgi:dihydrofolate synthase / folylpolyglutamate synthase